MNRQLSLREPTVQLRKMLLDNGLAILDQAGPDGVTIRAIARASGVSHAAPANHFADRRELLTAIALIIFRQYLAEVERQHDVLHNRAKAYLRALFDFSHAHPFRYDLLWRRDLIDWENAVLRHTSEAAYQDFLQSLASRQTQGASAETDIETLGTALWSMVHGYSDLRATRFFEARADKVTGRPRFEAMLSLLLAA